MRCAAMAHSGVATARRAVATFLAAFLLAAALLAAGGGDLSAQSTASPEDQIANWDATAARAERVLQLEQKPRLEALERLRVELIDQRAKAQELQSSLQASLEPLKSQLDALGPAPEDGRPEAEEIAERREALLQQISRLEVWLKEVGLALTRAASLQDQLARRQRTQFTKVLFSRGIGPLDAAAWTVFSYEAPQLFTAASAYLRDTAKAYRPASEHAPITIAFALLAILALVSWRGLRSVIGMLAESAAGASAYSSRIVFTTLEFALRAGPVPLLAFIFALVVQEAAQPSEAETLLLKRVVETIALLTAIWTLSHLAFCAEPETRRAIVMDPPGGQRVALAITAFAAVVAFDRLALDLLEIADASLATLSISNAFVATLAAASLLLLSSEVRIAAIQEPEPEQPSLIDFDDDDDAQPDFDLTAGAVLALRLLLIVAAFALFGAAVAGYYSLSRFILNGAAMSGLIVGGSALIYNAATRLLAPSPALSAAEGGGPAPLASRDPAPLRFLILFSLFIVAAPILSLVWGASKSDLASLIALLFGGVRVGGAVFSIGDALSALAVLVLGVWATRLVQRLLRKTILPGAGVAAGPRTAVTAGAGYLGFIFTFLLALSAAGLDLSNLAIIAGALSVGIGFGLQNVVNNFVSGLILLIERPIQAGDWIEVGGYSGYVRRINVRSTEIMTFDRASVIVPNSELISASVVNWTHKSLVGRAIVGVGVGYDSDTDQVRSILLEAALAHPMVLNRPEPFIYFKDFGASSLDFEVRCYLRDINAKLSVESELRYAILRRLREANIEIPFPQRVLHLEKPPEERLSSPVVAPAAARAGE